MEQLTYFQQYNLFADACGIHQGNLNEAPNQAAISLARRLVEEECNEELLPALTKFCANPSMENLDPVADGIADSIYVLCQLARSLGVPLDRVWSAVQSANMAKVGADGKVKRREDGKILKPEGWKPPDVFKILLDYSNELSVKSGTNGAENWDEFKKGVKTL